MTSHPPGNGKWLDDDAWKTAQQSLPICCVDVLPVRLSSNEIRQVGLILRDAVLHPRKWCLVGGRLFRDESLLEAAARQIRSTLGDAVRFEIPACTRPLYIAEYFGVRRENALYDPRQHALGLTFVAPVEGEVRPTGEALDFAWFAADALPLPEEFGFGQRRVVEACLSQHAEEMRNRDWR